MRLIQGLFVTALAFSSIGSAETIRSSIMTIKPTRITNRVVLLDNKESSVRVQVFSVFERGATDFSNTSKVIFAISQLGEITSVEASFALGGSTGLDSARRVAPGVYQVTYLDADKGMAAQMRTIDARKAFSAILNARCEEFKICEIDTVIDLK